MVVLLFVVTREGGELKLSGFGRKKENLNISWIHVVPVASTYMESTEERYFLLFIRR